jgi:hypothetical protein
MSLLLTLNNIVMRIRQATADARGVYNTAVQVYLHWRKGIIQPHVLPPGRLIQIL